MECAVCGKNTSDWIFRKVIDDDLVYSWRLTNNLRRQFDFRESQFCPKCHSSTRNRALAQAITKYFPFEGVTNLRQWVEKAKKREIKVAEINSCGKLHQFLKKLPSLKYSEYASNKKRFKSILFPFFSFPEQQEITSLTYPDESFDLVLHSEVLEHVPDPFLALKECCRVLRPGGVCLFTIPVIYGRKTLARAKIYKSNLNIEYLKIPSYHGSKKMIFLHSMPLYRSYKNDYLVFWEFGQDFIKKAKLKTVFSDPSAQTFVFALGKKII